MNEELFLELSSYNKKSRFYFENGLDIKIPTFYKNLLDNRYHKVSRIKKRLVYMFFNRKYLYFLTFTFDNDYIKKSDRTKKDLIKNCLNNIDDSLYMMNIDFGDKTEREHYHVLLGSNMFLNQTYFDLTYPCFSYLEFIRRDNKSVKKLSKYINKLSNHCCKDSTRNLRMYFNFKGYDDLNKLVGSHYSNLQYKLDYSTIIN